MIPTLMDFFKKHPLINPKTFLGDAAFDSIEIYKYLLQETSFEKACIPLKNKLKIEGVDYTVNDKGIPCCPHDPFLPMKWSVKEANPICVADFQLWNSSVRKWNGNGTVLLRNPSVYAIMITHAQLLPAEEWFTSTLKKLFILIYCLQGLHNYSLS